MRPAGPGTPRRCGRRRRGRSGCGRGCWSPRRGARRCGRRRPCWSRRRPRPTASRADPDRRHAPARGTHRNTHRKSQVAPTQVPAGDRQVRPHGPPADPGSDPARAARRRTRDRRRAPGATTSSGSPRAPPCGSRCCSSSGGGSPVAASATWAAGRTGLSPSAGSPACVAAVLLLAQVAADGARAGAGAGLRPGPARPDPPHRRLHLVQPDARARRHSSPGATPPARSPPTPATLWDLVVNYPGMLLATAATLCLVMVVATSIRAARRRLRYESWHLLHLYAYLGVGLAIPHQLWTGADFTSSTGPPGLLVVRLGRRRRQRAGLARRRCRSGATCATTSGSPPSSPRATAPSRCTSPAAPCTGCRSRPASSSPGASSAAPADARQPVLPLRGPRRPVLRITVQDVGDGSGAAAGLAVGSRVLGRGTLRPAQPARPQPAKVLLIGAGVGITPLRALAEGLDYAPGEAVLLYRSRRPDLRRRAHRPRAATAASSSGAPRTPTGPGLLARRAASTAPTDLAALTSWVPDVAERDVYVCGPGPGPTSSSATSARPACPSSTSISRTSAGDHVKRIVLWVLSTLSTVVVLFGYHTSTSSVMATSTPATFSGSLRGSHLGSARLRVGAGSGSTTGGVPAERRAPPRGSSTAASDRHRRRRPDPLGPGAGPAGRRRARRSPTSRSCSTPTGNGRDIEIASYALPQLIQETLDAQGLDLAWSAAPPTPARATCSRCRAPSTRRGCDRGGRPGSPGASST